MKSSMFYRLAAALAVLVLLGAAAVTARTIVERPPTAVGYAPEHGPALSTEAISTLFVFMLATFVGLDVIRRVSRLLHTPLMSLTNAISAIAVVGSILVAGREHADFRYNLLGLVAIAASVTNIVSGFLITDRMLKMFKRREGSKA
jgi:NAD(P) transhydrogenase subunit alpha